MLASNELREKFKRQEEKLNDALQEGRHADVVTLAAGMMRGWDALDKSAASAGHSPPSVDYWEVARGDKLYRVVKSSVEASMASVQGNGVSVVSVDELLGVYEHRHEQVYGKEIGKVNITPLPEGLLEKGGDDLGF